MNNVHSKFKKCRDQRMSGAIPPLPNTPSGGSDPLKHRDNFTFTFIHSKFKNYSQK